MLEIERERIPQMKPSAYLRPWLCWLLTHHSRSVRYGDYLGANDWGWRCRCGKHQLADDARDRAALALVLKELSRARAGNGDMRTAHEGYGVILEEMDELKGEVWKKRRNRDPQKLIREATQVAAMAVRFMVDVYGKHLEPAEPQAIPDADFDHHRP